MESKINLMQYAKGLLSTGGFGGLSYFARNASMQVDGGLEFVRDVLWLSLRDESHQVRSYMT